MLLPIESEPLMATKASQTPENSLPLSKHGTEPLLPIISHPVLDQSVDLIASDSLATELPRLLRITLLSLPVEFIVCLGLPYFS